MECLKECIFKGQVEECKNGCTNQKAGEYWNNIFVNDLVEIVMRVVIVEDVCPYQGNKEIQNAR